MEIQTKCNMSFAEVSKITKKRHLHLITPCHSCKLIILNNLRFKLNVYEHVGLIHCVESVVYQYGSWLYDIMIWAKNVCAFLQVFHEHPLMADYCSDDLVTYNNTVSNSTGYRKKRASIWNDSGIYSSNNMESSSLTFNDSYRDFRYVNINFI
jgi:hypothetical protein